MQLGKMAKFMRQISNDALEAEAKRRGFRYVDPSANLIRMSGRYRFELYDHKMELKDVRVKDNLVVNAGLNWIREYGFDSVTPTTLARMSRIAIGTGSTAAAATDTTLQTESARQVFTASTGYAAGGTGVCTLLTTFAAGTGTGTVTEAGIFNDATTGQMWNRVVFTGVAKGAGDTLKVTVTITFTAA